MGDMDRTVGLWRIRDAAYGEYGQDKTVEIEIVNTEDKVVDPHASLIADYG